MDAYSYVIQSRVTRLQHLLERQCEEGNPWKRERAQSITHFRGVRIAGIRLAVHQWNQEWKAECPEIPAQHRIDVALRLFQSSYLEDKISSIVFIDEVLFNEKVIESNLMAAFSDLFEAGLMSCYEVSDSFSTKVLTSLLIRERQTMIQVISQWFRSSFVWKARSALNSLIPLAKDAIYESLIMEGCSLLLPKSEQCAKSVVASALRALSYRSPITVYTFLSSDTNLILMTGPGLTKACGNHQDWKNTLRRRRREMILESFNSVVSGDIEEAIGDRIVEAGNNSRNHNIGYDAHRTSSSEPSHATTSGTEVSAHRFSARNGMAYGATAYFLDQQTSNPTQAAQPYQTYPYCYQGHMLYMGPSPGSSNNEAFFPNHDTRRLRGSSDSPERGQ